jgi:beta-galactosidase/beta-glucuronidase
VAFAFDDDDSGLRQGWQETSADLLRSGDSPFDRRITVPFCYQAELSGIGERAFHDVVWYARTFEYSSAAGAERLLLHFGAVDYRAAVWVNGTQVASHEGGHTPFSADIADALREGENVLVVRVEDPSKDVTIPRESNTGGKSPRASSTRGPPGSGRPSGSSLWDAAVSKTFGSRLTWTPPW